MRLAVRLDDVLRGVGGLGIVLLLEANLVESIMVMSFDSETAAEL